MQVRAPAADQAHSQASSDTQAQRGSGMAGWQSERPLKPAATSTTTQEASEPTQLRLLADLQHANRVALRLLEDRRSARHPADGPLTLASRAAANRVDWVERVRAFRRSVQLYNEFVHQQRRRPGGSALTATPVRLLPTEPEPTPAPPSNGHAVASPAPNGSLSPLTRRQRQVAGLIAAGKSNAAIAEELVLTPGTVANHIEHIRNRLGFKNRAQVAVWAVQAGLLPEDPEGDSP